MPIVKALVEFIVVAAATILAERLLSTRAAVGVLCLGLLLMGWSHWDVIKPVYEQVHLWIPRNKPGVITICIFLGASFGGGFGLWLTKNVTQPQQPAKTIQPPGAEASKKLDTPLPTRNTQALKTEERPSASEIADEVTKRLQQAPTAPTVQQVRRETVDLLRQMYDALQDFQNNRDFEMAHGLSIEGAYNGLKQDYTRENFVARIIKCRDELIDKIKQLPPHDQATDDFIGGKYTNASAHPLTLEQQIHGLRVLLNQMEAENGLPPSCGDLKLHFGL